MSAPASPISITALATHPIQYHAPWFRCLAADERVDLDVIFECLPDARAQGAGFGQAFQWDVPLLDGYAWQALPDGGAVNGQWLPGALLKLRAAFRRRRPDIVLLTGWQSPLLALAPNLAHRAGAGVLIRGESNLLRPRAAWKHRLHRQLMRRYDGFLSVGRRNRDFYLAAGVDAHCITDCPYFVDNDRFRKTLDTLDVATQRERFAVPVASVCVLFAGKLEDKKRPLDVVSALKHAGRPDLHLLIVGSGALEDELRRAARDLSVSFTGFLNQSAMPAAYAAADCLVLPSDHGETWGLVVNEAMACGLPAIVSDEVGCATDLIIPGETGRVFPVADVAALARCLGEVADDKEALAEMGRRARNRVCEAFTVDRATEAVVSAGIRVMEERSAMRDVA